MQPGVGDTVRLASPTTKEMEGPAQEFYGGQPRTVSRTEYPAGSYASGKVGRVIDLTSHPYGIEHGPVYKIQVGAEEFWVGPDMIEEIL